MYLFDFNNVMPEIKVSDHMFRRRHSQFAMDINHTRNMIQFTIIAFSKLCTEFLRHNYNGARKQLFWDDNIKLELRHIQYKETYNICTFTKKSRSCK